METLEKRDPESHPGMILANMALTHLDHISGDMTDIGEALDFDGQYQVARVLDRIDALADEIHELRRILPEVQEQK